MYLKVPVSVCLGWIECIGVIWDLYLLNYIHSFCYNYLISTEGLRNCSHLSSHFTIVQWLCIFSFPYNSQISWCEWIKSEMCNDWIKSEKINMNEASILFLLQKCEWKFGLNLMPQSFTKSKESSPFLSSHNLMPKETLFLNHLQWLSSIDCLLLYCSSLHLIL